MDKGNVGRPKRATRNSQPEYRTGDQDNESDVNFCNGPDDEEDLHDDEHGAVEAVKSRDAKIEEIAQKSRSKKPKLAGGRKSVSQKSVAKKQPQKAQKHTVKDLGQTLTVLYQDPTVDRYQKLRLDEAEQRQAQLPEKALEVKGKPVARYTDTYVYSDGIERSGPPVPTIEAMFDMFVLKLSKLPIFASFKKGFQDGLINVGTLCSGTECPILALELLQDAFQRLEGFSFHHEHLMSAEIDPFKQAYIHRNWPKVPIFRDIVEFLDFSETDDSEVPKATTVFGAKSEVPCNIDMLVAGFCCVDFSNLNTKPKTLEELGESGDTFHAIVAYATKAKPKIVIFENIVNTPWNDQEILQKKKVRFNLTKSFEEKESRPPTEEEYETLLAEETQQRRVQRGIDYYMDLAGYQSKHVVLDSREYLLPQTRNRGYMICVRREEFNSTEELTERIQTWADLVTGRQIPATVAADEMLLEVKYDVRSAPTLMEEVTKKKKAAPAWDKCRADHAKYRRELELGYKRFLTGWGENGSSNPPGSWAPPTSGMTNRVNDYLEIQHLRSMNRGYDDRYTSRHCDISQNVFRTTDVLKTGLISCLTPSGMPWSTTKGRLLTGREALTLQGLPVNRMDLSYLTDSEMQSMAGNAMSSTVVGVVMISALMVFHDMLNRRKVVPEASEEMRFENEGDLVENIVDPSALINPISVGDALRYARRTVKLCSCEGKHDTSDKKFKQCIHCGFITCVEHSRNPPHLFTPFSIEGRKFPGEFKKRLKEALPMRLSFDKSSIEGFRNANKVFDGYSFENQNDIARALDSELALQDINRSDLWEAVYDSPSAKLILRISQDDVHWSLYAHPPSNTPSDSGRRVQLEQFPIASMRPEGDNIMQGNWKLWLPKKHAVRVRLKSSGKLIQSSRAARGLESAKNTFVFNQWMLEVAKEDKAALARDISGLFDLHTECAKPFDSLHVKVESNSSKPLLLYLDHTRQTGNPVEHSFVLTEDGRDLEYGAYRELIARFPPQVKPPTFCNPEGSSQWQQLVFDQRKITKHHPGEKDPTSDYDIDGLLGPQIVDLPGRPNADDYVTETKIFIDGEWMAFPELGFQLEKANKVTYHRPHLHDSCINGSCKDPRAVFVCETTLPNHIAKNFIAGAWTTVGQENEVKFFNGMGHVLERGKVLQNHAEGQENWSTLIAHEHIIPCHDCAPPPPSILWHYDRKRLLDGKKSKGRQKLLPYEDPQQTQQYEQRLRDRPAPIVAKFRVDHNGKMVFKVSINSLSLVHCAVALMVAGGSYDGINAKVSLHTNDDAIPRAHLPPFALLNNDARIPIEQPKHLEQKGDEAGEEDKGEDADEKSIALRLIQRKTASWCVDMEVHPRKFMEMEIVEYGMDAFSYRLWAMAMREVVIRGGLLASSIGYGKTATILILCFLRFAADLDHSKKESPGYIPVKATLVILTPSLIDQWEGEINKFIKPGKNDVDVLKIKTMREWQNCSLRRIKQADFILFDSTVFKSRQYIINIAMFAGMAEQEDNASPRAKLSWYLKALERLVPNVERLKGNPRNLKVVEDILNEQIKGHAKAAQETQVTVPSKHVKGSKYVSFQDRKKDASEMEQAELEIPATKNFKYSRGSDGDLDELTNLPLESIDFARIIIDEFHYLDGDPLRHVEHLKRYTTWLLSGTPPLSGFADVKRIAKLLGARLGADDPTSMDPDVFKRFYSEMTETERFMMYQPSPSAHWKQARHSIAQKFLDHFARKDVYNYTDSDYAQHIHLSFQPSMQRIAYLELEQKLAGNVLEIPPMNFSSSDLDVQLSCAFSKYKSGEQVLLGSAASFHPTFMPRNNITAISTEIAREFLLLARHSDVGHTMKDLKHLSRKGHWLSIRDAYKAIEKWSTFIVQIENNSFGDSTTTKQVKYALEYAEEEAHNYDHRKEYCEFKDTGTPRGDTQTVYPYAGYLARFNGQVRTLAHHYLARVTSSLHIATLEHMKLNRALLFAKSVEQLQEDQLPPECNRCSVASPQGEFTVFIRCGHIICKNCLAIAKIEADCCPVQLCEVINVDYERVPATQFLGPQDRVTYPFGQKMTDIASLFQLILRNDKNSKILVFFQDDAMRVVLQSILEHLRISYNTLDESPKASERLTAFQDKKSQVSILFLNIASSSAAGCNLTMASYIIFVSPYLTNGSAAQQIYDSTMKQAIGRAHRYGQKKIVQVYHFLTAFTFDVDLFEERRHQIVDLDDATESVFVRDPEENEYAGPWASNISGIVLGRNQRV